MLMSLKTILDKIDEFFAPDPEPTGEPIEYEGKTYVPYNSKEDPEAVWPNATCPICNGLNLKRDLYVNRETNTYVHKEHLLKK
jgi:hypothetical protein